MLEIKQQTIMRAIDALVKSRKWGNPQGYDLIVEKVKTGARDLDVEYHVIPEPPSELDAGIAELARHVPVNLAALYEGKDPFAVAPIEEDTVNGDAASSDTKALHRARAAS